MDFIKRQMFIIVCILISGAGIALGITGLQGMPKVMEQMKTAEGLYRDLDGLRSKPVNQKRLDDEQNRIDLVVADRNRVIDKVKTLYQYDILINEVLPYGKTEDRIEFRRKYHDEMNNLLNSLTWGSIPSAADISLIRDKIEDEKAEKLHEDLGPKTTPAGILTKSGILQDPFARAALGNAQRIYCYAVDFDEVTKSRKIVPSLSYEPSMVDIDTADPPFEDEVWLAQLNYWIQRDVISTIVDLNEDAAQAASQNGVKPWVGIMPVKDVISIRLSEGFIPMEIEGEYVYGGAAGGTDPALPPGIPNTVFTHSASGEAFDVIQFSVKLVMDVRDIPLLVEKISNSRMHTLLRVAYQAIPLNRKMVGKIYGSEPTVNVVMDFETILLGEVFRRWMPELIRENNEIVCRDIDECQEPE